jgi:hypothetical protein
VDAAAEGELAVWPPGEVHLVGVRVLPMVVIGGTSRQEDDVSGFYLYAGQLHVSDHDARDVVERIVPEKFLCRVRQVLGMLDELFTVAGMRCQE